jgi:phenylpropionate dioxygenase-like ring-hydroxylating dioxygenase large terminal subunit
MQRRPIIASSIGCWRDKRLGVPVAVLHSTPAPATCLGVPPMLTAQQKTLRKFWYAVMPLSYLDADPQPFRLMGEDIVLFRDRDGEPVALADRCLHRTARLSKGLCEAGRIVCGYHGWTYDGTGRLVRVPQFDPGMPMPNRSVRSYRCTARYGYAWVALDDPVQPIFDIPEDGDPGFRRIYQFYERWDTAPLRFMENSFDAAHFSFVHRATFGDFAHPKPSKYELEETGNGFFATTLVDIVNPPEAYRVTGTTAPMTTRDMRNHWYLPFSRRLDITYPSGLRHIIINCATPIDDGRIQLVQLLYRNDSESDCPEQVLIDWDAAVIAEDRAVLESTDPDAPLDMASHVEANMPSDRPGLIMRRRLLELLRAHGEDEITRHAA